MSLKVFRRSRRRIRAALRAMMIREFNAANYAALARVAQYKPRRFAAVGFLIKKLVEVSDRNINEIPPADYPAEVLIYPGDQP